MNILDELARKPDLGDLLVAFKDDAELSAALADAAAGRGLAAQYALPLAVAYIRRLEATVRRLEGAQAPAAPTVAKGGQ
jgi:hypothetical protein